MVQLIHCKPGLAGRVKLSMTAGSNASWLEVDEVLHAAVIRWALIWWATPPHRLPDVDRHRLSKYSLSEAEDTTAPGGMAERSNCRAPRHTVVEVVPMYR